MGTGLKVFGYTRVSTDDQAVKGGSLVDQAAKVLAYAKAHGLDMVGIVEDAGESSKSLDRPGLNCILAQIRAGEARGIVVAYVDRLTRHVGDMVHLVENYFLKEGGARLYSASESVETRTASGRMLLYLLATVSQYQRELIVEKTASEMRAKRSRKERTGNIRFGQTTDAGDLRRTRSGQPSALVPCPEDMEILALILALRSAGLTTRAIADELNARGLPGKRGVTKKSTGRWSHSSVAVILKRERESENGRQESRTEAAG